MENPALPAGTPPSNREPPGHTDFEHAFTNGTVFVVGDEEVVMKTLDGGSLGTPTGSIVASDAMSIYEARPFVRRVPPGTYPVTLAWFDNCICCMKVQFSNNAPVAWEQAKREDEDPTPLPPGEFWGFGVDSGMAGFFDGDAALALADDESWADRFQAADASRTSPTCQIILEESTGASVVACMAGYGDGGYPCFWGLDAQGIPVCLVADFLVLTEEVTSTWEVPNLAASLGRTLTDPWLVAHGYESVQIEQVGQDDIVVHCKGREDIDMSVRSADGQQLGWPNTYGHQRNSWHFEQLPHDDPTRLANATLVFKASDGVRPLSPK
jgi:hypothetical protein